MSSIGWLHLPPEVRCTVYEYLFRSTEIEIHGEHKRGSQHGKKRSYQNIGILLTCKTVNSEGDPYFLAESEFFIKECPCWRRDPETRPRRLKEIRYLTFDTTASADHWVSLWYDLIWFNDAAMPNMSSIKMLKIAGICNMEEFETIMWLFDCVKGRFRHFEMLVDATESGGEEGYCTIVVDEKHNITITGQYAEEMSEIKALLIEACDSVTLSNMMLQKIDNDTGRDDPLEDEEGQDSPLEDEEDY